MSVGGASGCSAKYAVPPLAGAPPTEVPGALPPAQAARPRAAAAVSTSAACAVRWYAYLAAVMADCLPTPALPGQVQTVGGATAMRPATLSARSARAPVKFPFMLPRRHR